MICKVCGRTITNELANFCEYCGASFRPGADNKISEELLKSLDASNQTGGSKEGGSKEGGYTQAQYQQQASAQGMTGQGVRLPKIFRDIFDTSERPMTFGNWLILYLIPFIPMVGMILFLIVLFFWGFGANVGKTKKNWARATMVMVLIMIMMVYFMISSGYLGDPQALLESLYGPNGL